VKLDYPDFWKTASSKRKRIYLIVFFFVIAFIVTITGAFVPLSAQQSQQLYNQIANQTKQGPVQLGTSIFVNNFGLCLAMFIPLIGVAFGLFVMFDSGIALGAELRVESSGNFQASTPTPAFTPWTAILALTLIVTVFALEYVCYSTGMSESIWLFRRLRQQKWRRELQNTLILIGTVAAILAVSAVIETLSVKAGY